MESEDVEYAKMRRKRCYTKLTMVREERTMRLMLRHIKSSKQAYGGLPRKRTCTSIASNVIYVNDWVSIRRGQECHINSFFR